MNITLPSGFRIVMSPVLPWESPEGDLVIRCTGAFHPDHVTTRLCLRLMDLHQPSLQGVGVLDVGSGTGILALAAARLGARVATGVDISGRSILVARQNAARNGLLEQTHWVQGSADAVKGPFGWVMANLPFHILLGVLDNLIPLLAATGRLLLSGFHDIEWHHLRRRLEAADLVIQQVLSGDQSFAAEPPSGSYTWMAALAAKGCEACLGEGELAIGCRRNNSDPHCS
jgi:ribosomal protein L11 methyltransferase